VVSGAATSDLVATSRLKARAVNSPDRAFGDADRRDLGEKTGRAPPDGEVRDLAWVPA
jgi:hypothetical protein